MNKLLALFLLLDTASALLLIDVRSQTRSYFSEEHAARRQEIDLIRDEKNLQTRQAELGSIERVQQAARQENLVLPTIENTKIVK